MIKGTTERKGDAVAHLRRIKRALEGPKAVRVGFPAGAVDSEILARAMYNEFGTSRGVPERPFMRITLAENRDKYVDMARSGSTRITHGKANLSQVLSEIGLTAAGDIQKTISSSVPPPNAPETVARKGSSTTLIDTGQMRQSVTWVLEE